MKIRLLPKLASIIFLVTFTLGCEKEPVENISTYESILSHNGGNNCMQCHTTGEEGEIAGVFTVAGTVYNSNYNYFPNALVKLYTEQNANGTLVATIEVDKLGNFYTTQNIDFGTGLFPVVYGPTGNKYAMGSKITHGACGSCHNVVTNQIYAD